jgi:tRNA(Leu) C34 or U34 (ribose-2'-O)-methylase TrmL
MENSKVMIGSSNPKSPTNVAGVMRAAGCFGADAVVYTGVRYGRAAQYSTDTENAGASIKQDEDKVLLDRYSLFETTRERLVYNWLQDYSLEELTKEFAENRFSITETYADTVGAVSRPHSAEVAVATA